MGTKKRRQPKGTVIIGRGAATVRIYPFTRKDGYKQNNVCWHEGGRRRTRCFSDFDEAELIGQQISVRLANQEATGGEVRHRDIEIHRHCERLVEPFGVALVAVVEEWVAARKIAPDVAISEAVRYFADNGPGRFPDRTTAQVAARKALEAVGGNAPEGLRVHPEVPKKGTKVDPSTSGPFHPNTEEAARKALEAVGGNAPEGLRIHPEAPTQGTKVDPSTSGPVHPKTEESARRELEKIGGNAPEGLRIHPADPKDGAKVKPGDEAGVTKAAQFIDDGEFRKLQTDQALALRKKGHLVKADELGKQLKRKSVQLTLPKAESPASPLSLTEIYRKCSQSIFSIAEVRDCEGCGKTHVTPYGTAFAVTADGVLLTNYHLIESLGPNSRMVATAVDGTTYPVVEVLAASKIDDAAAIRIGGSGFIPLALSTDNVVGTRVSVISHPRGHLFSLSEGIVTRLFTQFSTRSMLVSAEYAVGSSGAPVLDSSGNVLGMVAVTDSLNDQMVLRGCIPSQSLLELITDSGSDSPKPAPDPLAAERACLKETFAAMQQLMQQQGEISPQEFTKRLGVLNASMKHSAERCPDDPIAKRYLQTMKLQGSRKTPAPGK